MKFLRLNKIEWISLITIVLLTALALSIFQNNAGNRVSLQGDPRFIKTFGQKSLKSPLSVAYFKNRIAVTSSSDSNVKVFTSNGDEAGTIVIPGNGYPSSLAVESRGILYIGDLSNKSIYSVNLMGNFSDLKKVKLKGKIQPISMTIHQDKLMVFDAISQRIKLLNNDRFDDFSKDKKLSLSYANGIISDGRGIYVADSNSRRVIRLDDNGIYKATLRNFSLPRGIAVDSLNRLHVIDTFSHTVKVFGSNGVLMFNYGSEGNSAQQLYFPNGIAIDSDNARIYIADKGNDRLQVWGW